jgi:hypothetical protein
MLTVIVLFNALAGTVISTTPSADTIFPPEGPIVAVCEPPLEVVQPINRTARRRLVTDARRFTNIECIVASHGEHVNGVALVPPFRGGKIAPTGSLRPLGVPR